MLRFVLLFAVFAGSILFYFQIAKKISAEAYKSFVLTMTKVIIAIVLAVILVAALSGLSSLTN